MAREKKVVEFVDEEDSALEPSEVDKFSEAVLYSTDWTVETILGQLSKKNIELNPRFQRRDAWSVARKGRFIESVIIGLPIPQIVLAEDKNHRGRFIVLDGKQRLLSLLQFTGRSKSTHNGFRLSGLEARIDLKRKTYADLEAESEYEADISAFMNHTIRTVVIRNWPTTDFLHLVFLRLNTGSVTLSPQELRQAMVPGPFSDYADDAAIKSKELKALLGREDPDPRMRDVELLVRYLSMKHFLPEYGGRMKSFLDSSCAKFNKKWKSMRSDIEVSVEEFSSGVQTLLKIFGEPNLARKLDSYSFNRAIFDALIYYASRPNIRTAMQKKGGAVRNAYTKVLRNKRFADAIESDTAGIPHTVDRLAVWGSALSKAIGVAIKTPKIARTPNDKATIRI